MADKITDKNNKDKDYSSENEDTNVVADQPTPPKDFLSNPKVRFDPKAREMAERLNKQPKVSISVPLGFGETEGEVFVGINGYNFYIAKGQVVEVPKQVADLINDSIKNTAEAENNSRRIDKNPNLQRALS